MVAPVSLSSDSTLSSSAIEPTHLVDAVSLSSSSSMGAAKIRQRFDVFAAMPDWTTPVVERLDWLTDTSTAYDGTEQRIKLREWPRRAIEFGFGAGGALGRSLQAFLFGRGAREFLLPIWQDGTQLQADVAPGTLAISTPTQGYDFQVGAFLVIMDAQGEFEAAEVADIEPGVVTLRQDTARAWPAGCMVYPARLGRLPTSQSITRFSGDFFLGRARVELQDRSEWPAEVAATTYRGSPVLTERPNWIGEVDQELTRKLAQLDFGTGARAYSDESGLPEIRQSFRWFLESRTRVGAFRSWLYARAGRFGAVWVPTWANDLVLKANVGSGSTTWNVEACGYVRHFARSVHRRDVRIELTSGAVYYRRITNAVEVDATTESLTIDSALGVLVTPASVVSIGFLALCRQEGDGVEIAYFTGSSAEAVTNMRATRAEP